MQLTAIFLLGVCLQLSASGLSQNVTFSAEKAPLSSAFKAIEEQTGYVVVYYEKDLKEAKPITIKASRLPLEDFVRKILADQEFEYVIKEKTIAIKKVRKKDGGAKFTPLLPAFIDPPPIKISGTVTGVNGQPLAGATIRVKGKNINTTSNDQGYFELMTDAGSMIVISYIGFRQSQFKADNTGSVRIELIQEQKNLDTAEVVFSTGYQNLPKERATGSFVQIDNTLLTRSPTANILDRINYVTSGLRYDEVGSSGTKYVIRGFSTIRASRQPLIVIDGFPYEEYPATGIIERLNPNDVESITILRDAAAASIWGARSGNGVIVVTTKKGKFNSRAEVALTSNVTYTEKPPISRMNILSSQDAIEFERKVFQTGIYDAYDDIYPGLKYFPSVSPVIEILLAGRRNELSPDEVESKLDGLASYDIRNDVNNHFLKDGLRQQHALSVNGGTERSSYYASLGFDHSKSVYAGNSAKRYTVNIRNTHKISSFIDLGYYIDYSQNTSSIPNISYVNVMPTVTPGIAPYMKLSGIDGNALSIPVANSLREKYIDTITAPGLVDWHYRPLDELKNGSLFQRSNSTRVGGNIKFNILKALSIDFKGQYISSNSENSRYSDGNAYENRRELNRFVFTNALGQLIYPYPQGGKLNAVYSDQSSWNLRAQINYNNRWNKHAIHFLTGLESSEAKSGSRNITLLGYNSETLTSTPVDVKTSYNTRPSGSQVISVGSGAKGALVRYFNYYSNASYVFDSRYTFSASGRIDAANLIGVKANLRRVPLWSVGVAWNISNEQFFNIPFITELKIRANYGWNGNINNSVSTLPTINYRQSSSSFTDLSYAEIVNPPNPNLTWEKIKTTNIGIDLSILKRRLSASVEYYQKDGVDLIGPITTDPTRGVSLYTGNYASIRGKGIDVQLTGNPVAGNNYNWNISANFSTNIDKVTDYNPVNSSQLPQASDYLNSNYVIKGLPLYHLHAYKWGGLNSENGSPMGILSDTITSYLNAISDKNTHPEDLINFGSPSPRISGNILNSFNFKSLTVSWNISYSLKYFFRRPSISYTELLSNWAAHSDYKFRWRKTGDELYTQVPSEILVPDSYRDQFYANSSILIDKGDHFRIQDVRIEYIIPLKIRIRNSIPAISMNFTATNLGIIWRANKHQIDPDNISVQLPKSYTVGILMKL